MTQVQIMALFPILAVPLVLIVLFAAWRIWIEHRRYDEFARVLAERSVTDSGHTISAVPGSASATRPGPHRLRAERSAGPRRSAGTRTPRRFRVVEN